MEASTAPPPVLYHERQRRLCCGVHALNNCFQQPWVDAAALDHIAVRMAAEQGAPGTGAFRSWLPRLGNWDIGVLVAALQDGQGARLSQHLLANAALAADLGTLRAALLRQQGGGGGGGGGSTTPRIQGVLVNIRSRNRWSRWLLDGRHWLALIRSPTNGLWYDMDSKLPAPEALGNVDKMLDCVKRCIEQEDGQAFVVEVGTTQTQEQQPPPEG